MKHIRPYFACALLLVLLARADAAQAAPATAQVANPSRVGPVGVGDRVEVPWAGGWVPGTVLHVEGLTYFIHYGDESDDGKYDDFFTLNRFRPVGGPQTYAAIFRGTVPDPDGGPIALGTAVEFYEGIWQPARLARRLGERYVVFTDKLDGTTEIWLTPDKVRLVGSATPLAPNRGFKQREVAVAADVRSGDLVEASPRRAAWAPLTVLARKGDSYFVKWGPHTGISFRGWVDLQHLRPVGAKEPFQPEDLGFFVGRWALTGDSFQTLVDRKFSGRTVTETFENNSGVGKRAGQIVINRDGTYQLSNTTVFHDGKGRWERNPNQNEGGILLRGADGKTGDKDCVVTNHQDGFAYLQGDVRGPGKWCTRIGN